MPNVGKPSKSCAPCRDRRAKCDLKHPCTQCIKIGKECYGYRDPLSMMFKNENDVVMKRAQRKYDALSKTRREKRLDPKIHRVQESSFEVGSCSPSSSPLCINTAKSERKDFMPISSGSPARPMSPSIEHQALTFFAANNISQPAILGGNDYQWLFQMLSDPETDAALQSSINAASLATFATVTKSPPLMKKAREHYVRALNSTNRSLSDLVKVREDTTLVSVILLGMFENLVFEKHSLAAWTRHIKGAEMLFALRGEAQFGSDLARQIFIHFHRTTMTKGIELGTPVPEKIAHLYRHLTSLNDYIVHGTYRDQCDITTGNIHVASSVFVHLLTYKDLERQAKFLEKAIALMQDDNGNPAAAVSGVLKLDRELDMVKVRLQTLWRYDTVHLEKPEDFVFGNTYHVYPDPWVINMWNVLRICRIRLFKFVRTQVSNGLQRSPPVFSDQQAAAYLQDCKEVIGSQVLDICASTPQLTGQIAFPRQVKNDLDTIDKSQDIRCLHDKMLKIHAPGTFLEPFKSTGLDYLIGPLYEIGRTDYGPRLTRWAADQLYFVARRIGTRQAIMLAEELEEKLKNESNFMVWNDPCPTTAQLIALAKEGESES